ncbi:VanZ family protein [Paenibacillus humicus]|uniref:VanZ family protein n=1 Tax=Paenibacillus humicus TaxID=412861 RepID=UPI003F141B6B
MTNYFSRKFFIFTFILYGILLSNLTIFKYFGSMQQVIRRIEDTAYQKKLGYLNLNLVPFKSIASSIGSYMRIGTEPSANLVGNIILFVPMGFLLPLIIKKPSFLKTIGISFVIIFSIEIIQFITCLGVADIDDVILNIAGCAIGYTLYLISKNLMKNKISKNNNQQSAKKSQESSLR